MKKNYIILRMYDTFRCGASVKIDECCEKYDISVATFRRYLAFLRSYFSEIYGREIIYNPDRMVYRLENAEKL